MSEQTVGPDQPFFDRRVRSLFVLPQRIGEAISGWDDPRTVSVDAADHMRPDDYVIGIRVGTRARAYPLWIIDNYHVVNDSVEDQRVLVTSCERCQSGAAFLPAVPGNPSRTPIFRAVGFMNATLVMKDMRIGAHWNHYDGSGLSRGALGVRLPPLPAFHME